MTRWSTKIVFLAAAQFIACTKKTNSQPLLMADSRCQVTKADIVQRVTTTGTIASARKWLLTAPYNGYLKRVYVKQGSYISEGTDVALFSQTLSREDQSFPVKAPFSGVVSHVMRNEGEALLTTDKGYVVRLDDLSKIYVDVKLGEADRGKVKLKQPAIVRVNALPDKTYSAQIELLSLATVELDSYRESNDFYLRARIQDKDDRLLPGMTVLMDIIIDKAEGVPTLAHECIQRDEQGAFVILKNGTRVEIQTGLEDEQRSEIKSGVQLGDIVKITDFAAMIEEK